MITVAFISFAYYIQFNELQDPNNQKNWNIYLNNVSKINFCAQNYDAINSPQMDTNNTQNVSIPIMVISSISDPPATTLTGMYAIINGSLLGLQGDMSSKNFSFKIDSSVFLNDVCSGKSSCTKVVPSCLTITAPIGTFPNQRYPVSCNSSTSDMQLNSYLELSGYNEQDTPNNCSVIASVMHKDDLKLVVMVTLDTRTRVHTHLMYGSYFLIVVIFTVILFSSIKGGIKRHDKLMRVQLLR
uniref:TMEM248/TMEM219 domain-containing protein n=1 Tax=Ciona savignyi TaxID=51511 RepID=H2ZLV4_CIOSA